MYSGKKIVVVMPAYNAATTLERTYGEVMAHGIVDHVVVVDDASHDATVAVAEGLAAVTVHRHDRNRGYGGNQKSCYRLALELGADVVVMVHPDYQYTPALLPAMVSMVASGLYSCVLASRILGGQARASGMPAWRYVANRALTLFGNLAMGSKLSEFHTGYRAYSRELLENIPWERNSDDFVFDNQILAQILWRGEILGEVSCPARYTAESSSIGFGRSVRYGFGCVATGISFRLARMGLRCSPLFER